MFCDLESTNYRLYRDNTKRMTMRNVYVYPMINDGVELRRAREIRLFLVADKSRRVYARTGSVLSKYVCRSSNIRFTFTRAFNISERRWEIHIHRDRVRAILAATNAPETDSQKR